MRGCSVLRRLEIVEGGMEDYERLAHFHYRGGLSGAYAAIFAIRPGIGVIVYQMPNPQVEMRNVATGGFFSGLGRGAGTAILNKNVRCITRVIIEPRFRQLGLAVRLVKETMGRMNVAMVEALAVMGYVNPFFEKAGMQAFFGKATARSERLTEALSMAGIEGNDLLDAEVVEKRLRLLRGEEAGFIEREIRKFLGSYGRMREAEAGIERTKFVLSRLAVRPVYYVWFNDKVQLKV